MFFAWVTRREPKESNTQRAEWLPTSCSVGHTRADLSAKYILCCHQRNAKVNIPNTLDRNLTFAVPTRGSLGAKTRGKVADGVLGERGCGDGRACDGVPVGIAKPKVRKNAVWRHGRCLCVFRVINLELQHLCCDRRDVEIRPRFEVQVSVQPIWTNRVCILTLRKTCIWSASAKGKLDRECQGKHLKPSSTLSLASSPVV